MLRTRKRSWTRKTVLERMYPAGVKADPDVSQGQAADRALVRGLLAVYDRQTKDEQMHAVVRHHNGRGFVPADAVLLSSFARQARHAVEQKGRREWEALSEKQMVWVRKKMRKYGTQLAKIARGVL